MMKGDTHKIRHLLKLNGFSSGGLGAGNVDHAAAGDLDATELLLAQAKVETKGGDDTKDQHDGVSAVFVFVCCGGVRNQLCDNTCISSFSQRKGKA